MNGVTSELIPRIREFRCPCLRMVDTHEARERWTNTNLKIIKENNSLIVADYLGDKNRVIFEISQSSDSYSFECVDNDRAYLDIFFDVRVIYKRKKIITIFRMKDIVQQRWLMVSLGAVGRGLYSPPLGIEGIEFEKHWTGKWDRSHAVESSQNNENNVSRHAQESLNKLQDEMEELDQLQTIKFRSPFVNRAKHDTFLPPLGPPVMEDINNQQKNSNEYPSSSRQPDPITACKQILYMPDKKEPSLPDVDHSPGVASYHIDRAIRRKEKWGAWIVAQGIKGVDGIDGISGHNGKLAVDKSQESTRDSYLNRDGNCGGNGIRGTNGSHGTDGANGFDLLLYIDGNSKSIEVSGDVCETLNFGIENSDLFLFVDCSGGQGGHGADGGRGGNGGRGGRGGGGRRGKAEYITYLETTYYDPAGNGGKGGRGGDGGNGAKGGDGGNGGNSGNGGCCVIQTSNPSLLHLVEVAVNSGGLGRCGNLGLGGEGGDGGLGGYGGLGGLGGLGMNGKQQGEDGPPGNEGFIGGKGENGIAGNNGVEGMDGGLLFVLLSPDSQHIIEQSPYRFNVQIDPTSLVILPSFNEIFFEPNEQITVTAVTVSNNGQMALPKGASLSMVSTPEVKFEAKTFDLPSLRKEEVFKIKENFSGRIYSLPPPNTQGQHTGEACLETKVELLGRPFDSGETIHKLLVQYPIKIGAVRPESLGRGEQGLLTITLKNMSALPYGNCSNSGGKLSLRIHFDKRITPLIDAFPFYKIHFDPNIQDSCKIDIHLIDPNAELVIDVNVGMSNMAELFEKCPIQVDLLLRDKLIEYQQEFIRVVPFYTPSNPPADILFVTDHSITRKEFVLWQRLFEILGSSVDFWDKDHYDGFSYKGKTGKRHQITWNGNHSGSLILFPSDSFEHFHPIDVYIHLTDNKRGENDNNSLFGDSGILFIDTSSSRNMQKIKEITRNICLRGQSFTFQGIQYGGNHIQTPNEEDFVKKKTKILKKLEYKHQNNRCYVTNEVLYPQRHHLISFTYGTLVVHRIPLGPSAKFTIVNRAITKFSSDDKIFIVDGQNEIPLSNNWSQTLLYILYRLPTYLKFNILQSPRNEKLNVTFVTPAGYLLELIDLVELVLIEEIISEIKCMLFPSKLAALTARVLGNLDSFVINSSSIFSIIIAVKLFAKGEIPKINKEVKIKVIQLCQQMTENLIKFRGKTNERLFNSIKNRPVGKKIHFGNLIDTSNTFEPQCYNHNGLNNDIITI